MFCVVLRKWKYLGEIFSPTFVPRSYVKRVAQAGVCVCVLTYITSVGTENRDTHTEMNM